MRILAAACIALALVASAGRASVAAGSGTHLAAGDRLVYEITVELQQHHTTSGTKPQDTALESAVQGNVTFAIASIESNGTALADVDVSFQGTAKGHPFESHSTTTARVMPDGRLLLGKQFGLGISDAISFANTTTAELTQHTLRLGAGWTSPQNTPYVRLTLARKVTGSKTYQGYSAFEVQTLGTGELLKTTDGKAGLGTVAVSGTSYYDEADHLLIGEALRTLTVVQQTGNGGAHDNYSATMNAVLSSWSHASPGPSASGAPASGGPEATPAPQSTTPAPVPSMFGPTPYPTVTPRLGQ